MTLSAESAQPTLFIHIGTHKTGTTSIQNFLRTHASTLRECGIVIPAAGTLGKISGHHNIAWQIRNDPRYKASLGGINDLIAELKCCRENTAVISSEDFEYLSRYPNELKTFDDGLEAAGFKTKYVVYFRDVEGYARSLFCELEGQGWADYDAFRKHVQRHGFVCINGDWYYEFRYELFVATWQKILGPKVEKYSYDEAVHGLGLLPSFLLTIGASKAVIDESLGAPMLNTMFDKYRAMRDKYQAIRTSKSWRITRPLRTVRRWFDQ